MKFTESKSKVEELAHTVENMKHDCVDEYEGVTLGAGFPKI